MREILAEEQQLDIPYSTLTRMVREMDLRQDEPVRRAGQYHFAPGAEMQHDTSPHRLIINGKRLTAQCADLVLAYSRRAMVCYYPNFTRFEAKVFLREALVGRAAAVADALSITPV
jgi:hypothetical protein